MPQHLERLRVLVGEDGDPHPVGERAGQVPDLAVHAHGERGLRQARADRPGQVRARGAGG